MSVRKGKFRALSASKFPMAGSQLGEIHLAMLVTKCYVCIGRRNMWT